MKDGSVMCSVWARRWLCISDSDDWPVRRQTYSYHRTVEHHRPLASGLQIILLGDRGTCLWTFWQDLLAHVTVERAAVDPATSWSRVRRPNHYITTSRWLVRQPSTQCSRPYRLQRELTDAWYTHRDWKQWWMVCSCNAVNDVRSQNNEVYRPNCSQQSRISKDHFTKSCKSVKFRGVCVDEEASTPKCTHLVV